MSVPSCPYWVAYGVMALMVSLPLVGVAATQVGGVAERRDVERLRSDFDTNVPSLVERVGKIEKQIEGDKNSLHELQTQLMLTQACVKRLEAYSAYIAGTLTAIIVGMILQVWQQLSGERPPEKSLPPR